MKIKLSKSQWEDIGKKADWVKTAISGDNPSDQDKINQQRTNHENFIRRRQEEASERELAPLYNAVGKPMSISQLATILSIAKSIADSRDFLNDKIGKLKQALL